ncbi:PD-(D/E)XK nuclease family protein [Paludisphaera borealis]|uniref:PD-(D/E)XK nuclease family protein n=1 Tax=Paludisphaera borealis TaxID=1387353 RepID=UPI001F2AD954|nr:PD-(D/E)XK nuclease family protein [Paludisphaera borealis]
MAHEDGAVKPRKGSKVANGPISASEIACFAYCPEQWRLEYGLGLEAANRAERAAGTRHHNLKAVAERVAGGSIVIGRLMAVLAIPGLLLWLVLSR